MERKAGLTIGLPVYNAENYLEEALDSILAQTHSDLKLVIFDNASTDRTGEICRAYAARDPRIVYHRNEVNVGGARNFNEVFRMAETEYFKWAAHDDVLAPEFLERCLSALEGDPSLVLCHCRTGQIDSSGKLVGTYDHEMRLESPRVQERFGDLLDMEHPVWAVYGVIRAEVLARTPLLASYVGSDRNLLAEIALHGPIRELPEILFYRREHHEASSTSQRRHADGLKKHDQRLAWFDPRAKPVLLPYWRRCREYLSSVDRAPLGLRERMLCRIQVASWVRKEGWRLMASDVERRFVRTTPAGRRAADWANSVVRAVRRRARSSPAG